MFNVLVTGGAGFVGSHICKTLASNGYTPIVYDNLSHGHSDFVKWGPLVQGDLNNMSLLINTLRVHSIAAVIHCAALAYVRESFERPLEYYSNNISGSITLLNAMREAEVLSIIISSSCSVYGIPNTLPVTESSLIKPISVYGMTKATVENMVEECVNAYGFKSISLRYFNAAGADPDGELGELHNPEPHVLPNILNSAFISNIPFSIYGSDFNTPDGSAIRDYVHVSDLANAHVRALEYLNTTEGYKAFNLGSGKGTSIIELINRVEKITCRKIDLRKEKSHQGDPPILFADISKAKKSLGWVPEISDIDNIIKDSWVYLNKSNSKK